MIKEKSLVGRTVKTNTSAVGSSFPNKKQVKLLSYISGIGRNAYYQTDYSGYNIYAYQFDSSPVTKSELQEYRDGMMNEVSDINSKLNWMDDTGSTEFDEDEYKAWKTLEIVESAKTRVEKAKAIAKLIKGEN